MGVQSLLINLYSICICIFIYSVYIYIHYIYPTAQWASPATVPWIVGLLAYGMRPVYQQPLQHRPKRTQLSTTPRTPTTPITPTAPATPIPTTQTTSTTPTKNKWTTKSIKIRPKSSQNQIEINRNIINIFQNGSRIDLVGCLRGLLGLLGGNPGAYWEVFCYESPWPRTLPLRTLVFGFLCCAL